MCSSRNSLRQVLIFSSCVLSQSQGPHPERLTLPRTSDKTPSASGLCRISVVDGAAEASGSHDRLRHALRGDDSTGEEGARWWPEPRCSRRSATVCRPSYIIRLSLLVSGSSFNCVCSEPSANITV